MSEQQDRGRLTEAMMEVACDHCGHRYAVHYDADDLGPVGCNICDGEESSCPGFHAGTVNVDTSSPCANCNHTEHAHVISYKGDVDDYCNVLECMCRKYVDERAVQKDGTGQEIVEETTEQTIIETTVTRTTTITIDLPIGAQELIDELNRIATAHGPGAEITKSMVYTDGLMTVERLELTIE